MSRDGARFQQAMLGATSLTISSITVLETKIVLQSRHGDEAVDEFDGMLKSAGIVVVPFDAEMADAAFHAFRRYAGQTRPAVIGSSIRCTEPSDRRATIAALMPGSSRPLCARWDRALGRLTTVGAAFIALSAIKSARPS